MRFSFVFKMSDRMNPRNKTDCKWDPSQSEGERREEEETISVKEENPQIWTNFSASTPADTKNETKQEMTDDGNGERDTKSD